MIRASVLAWLLLCGCESGGTLSGDGRPITAGDVRAGDVDAGDVLAGDVDAGPVSAGPVTAGAVSAGAVTAGDVLVAELVIPSVTMAVSMPGSVRVLNVLPSPDPAAAWDLAVAEQCPGMTAVYSVHLVQAEVGPAADWERGFLAFVECP